MNKYNVTVIGEDRRNRKITCAGSKRPPGWFYDFGTIREQGFTKNGDIIYDVNVSIDFNFEEVLACVRRYGYFPEPVRIQRHESGSVKRAVSHNDPGSLSAGVAIVGIAAVIFLSLVILAIVAMS